MILYFYLFNNLIKLLNKDKKYIYKKYNYKRPVAYKVLIIFNVDGNIWFCLKDIMIIFGYSSIDKMINKFNIDDNYKKQKIIYNKLFINESRLYDMLTKSNNPITIYFKDKYYKEISPQIRKTGKFILDKNDMNKIKKNILYELYTFYKKYITLGSFYKKIIK